MQTTEEAYLTKRVVERATRRGVREAAKETMNIMGHVVIVKDGWVVKQYPDGSIEYLQELTAPENTGPISLD